MHSPFMNIIEKLILKFKYGTESKMNYPSSVSRVEIETDRTHGFYYQQVSSAAFFNESIKTRFPINKTVLPSETDDSLNDHALWATIILVVEESSLSIREHSTLSRTRLISIKHVSYISEDEEVLTSDGKVLENSIEFVVSEN